MIMRTVPVNLIHPSDYNPRKKKVIHEKLKRSIKKYNYVDPIVWNERTGRIVGGHQRFWALVDLGYTEIEVSVVNLSPEDEKALNIALNSIQGEWDEQKLADLLTELSNIPDFDITTTGFDPPQIGEILDRVHDQDADDGFDFDAEVEAIVEPITKKGDLIELGPHRILCGDSAIFESVKRLFGNLKAALGHLDPPYGCGYLAQNRPDLESRPKKSKRWQKLYKDDLNEEDYETWLDLILKNLAAFLEDGASTYIWNGHAKFYFMHHALKKLGFHISTIITWAKPTFALSYGDFNQQTEFCMYAWLKNGAHKWYGPTNETNLWEIDRDKTAELIHPTQKSVKIPARAIRNSSQRGDIVVDLFLGSGSTLIAAQSLERRCFGIEIEPKYVDGIVRRYIAFVGKENVSAEIKAKYLTEVSK